MKKLLSRSFAFLIVLSVMHITIAINHFGSDNATFERISIDGKLASCGMEEADGQCTLPGTHLGTHCCNDKVSVFAVDNNYSPSYLEFKAFSQHILQVFDFPVNLKDHSLKAINLFSTSVSPSGYFIVSSVSLPDICVFRI